MGASLGVPGLVLKAIQDRLRADCFLQSLISGKEGGAMNSSRCKTLRLLLVLFATVWLTLALLEGYAEARAGGGRSGGSRGSRSYQAPARPSQPTQPTQPRRESASPAQQPSPVTPQPGGFMRGLAGGLLGGFLGAMLFSSFAEGGWGGFGGSGFGLIEILLLAGLGYLIFRMIRRPAPATGYGARQYQSTGYSSPYERMPAAEPPAVDEPNFSSIRMLDPGFKPEQFIRSAQDIFFKAQAAWSRQETATLASLCGPVLARAWGQELIELRARGQSNHIENIALRATEITEVWTEQGQDYITVRFEATLLDYTVNEKSGLVVTGSRSEPVAFEEFWTFSRPVGPSTWKLTAIQQA